MCPRLVARVLSLALVLPVAAQAPGAASEPPGRLSGGAGISQVDMQPDEARLRCKPAENAPTICATALDSMTGAPADPVTGGRRRATRTFAEALGEIGASPQSEGASGSDQNTVGSAAAGSTTLRLGAIIDFKDGQGIRVNHAGAAFRQAQPRDLAVMSRGVTGSATYSYQVACVDDGGGVGVATEPVTLASGNAKLDGSNPGNFNALTWMGSCPAYAVYRDGALVGTSTLAAYNDYGVGPGGFAGLPIPDWLPSAPQAIPLADWFVTSVASGGGTASLTLAAPVDTEITGQPVYHDDTASMAAVLAPSRSRVRNSVFIPCGTYHITSALPISQPHIAVRGTGRCSKISKDSVSADLFTASAANFLDFDDFIVESSVVQTGGYILNFVSGGSNNIISRLAVNGGFDAVHIPSGGNQNVITSSVFNNQKNNGIVWDTGYGGLDSVANVLIGADAFYNVGVGMLVRSASTLEWSNINVAGQYIPILIAPMEKQTVEDIVAVNVSADGCGAGCRPPGASAKARFLVDGSLPGAVAHRIRCINCWAGAGPAQGFLIYRSDDFSCSSCHALANQQEGILIKDSTDLRLSELDVKQNGTGTPGGYNGVEISGHSSHVNLTGGRIGSITGRPATQKSAVAAGPGADYVSITGVDMSGNLQPPHFDSSVTHVSIIGGF